MRQRTSPCRPTAPVESTGAAASVVLGLQNSAGQTKGSPRRCSPSAAAAGWHCTCAQLRHLPRSRGLRCDSRARPPNPRRLPAWEGLTVRAPCSLLVSAFSTSPAPHTLRQSTEARSMGAGGSVCAPDCGPGACNDACADDVCYPAVQQLTRGNYPAEHLPPSRPFSHLMRQPTGSTPFSVMCAHIRLSFATIPQFCAPLVRKLLASRLPPPPA